MLPPVALAGWVAAIGYWCVRKFLRVTRHKTLKGQHFKVYWDPAVDYKASNPWWLVEAVQVEQTGELTFPCDECPLLTKFKDEVLAGKWHVRPGAASRQQLFQLEEEVMYLNHGSYGATLRLASRVQHWYQSRLEAQPVRFMESEMVPCLAAAVAQVAEMVGADWQDVVPVTNATSAMNAVINSVPLGRGDFILTTSISYPAVRSAIARRAASCGASFIEVSLGLRELQDEVLLLEAFSETLKLCGRHVRLAVLDHVVSFPPVVMPLQQLAAMATKHGAQVLVDGAHATGAIEGLDITSYGAHYYVSNLHKWMCTPKGTGYLWVHPQHQHSVKPLVTSHGYGLGFRGEFLWQGTTDCTSWLAVPASLAVMEAFGIANVVRHNHELVQSAAAQLQRAWGTKCVLGVDGPNGSAGMAAVELPLMLGYSPPSSMNAVALQKLLRYEHHIEVPVVYWEQRLWVRISAQLYNQAKEYEELAKVVCSHMHGT